MWACATEHGKVWQLLTHVIGNYSLQDLLQATKMMRLAAQDPSVKVRTAAD